MERFLGIAAALLGLAVLHFGSNALFRKGVRTIGRAFRTVARPGLEQIETKSRRKQKIQFLQEERRKNGAPPLENPNLE